MCYAFVGLAIGWLFYAGEFVLRVLEEMLLAYYLAAFPILSGMWKSRLCMPCTFCWLVLWGSGKLGA